MAELIDRLCGQPVSWGINYLPGWGVQLSAEQVLADMQRAGLAATEFQPGLFPAEPQRARELFATYSLHCIAGWVPLVLHNRPLDAVLAEFDERARFLEQVGASIATIGAVTSDGDFETKPDLTDDEWREVLAGLDAISAAGGERGIRCVLHPHVGTVVESAYDIDRVLDGSSIDFCLDIGHIYCGGGDPVAVAQRIADRIGHVHLKDVDTTLANSMVSGSISWADGVAAGVFKPLGQGDIDLAEIFKMLDETGYDGWFVIEQDKRLQPDSPPPLDDVKASVQFLTRLAGVGITQPS